MCNPIDLAVPSAGIENDRTVGHWAEPKPHEVRLELGGIPMQEGATR